MINLLFGLKHKEAMQNVYSIADFLKHNEKSFNLKVICFFNLQKEDLKKLSNYNIESINLPQNLKIKGDKSSSRIISFIKLVKFQSFLKKNSDIIKESDSLIVSPGGFLLDQLAANFEYQNKPAYILQNGFITPDEKIETESKKSSRLFDILFNSLTKFSKTFEIRKVLNTVGNNITFLAFNNEYRDYIKNSNNYIQNVYTVGSPRLKMFEDTVVEDSQNILYLSSSALYENNEYLHELIKEQILDLYKLLSPKNYNIGFRPHPRDSYDWPNYLKDTDISILNNDEELLEQIMKYKYIISERSTVIIQGILSGKVSFWVHKDQSRIYNYEHIRVLDENSLVKILEQCNLNNKNYKILHENQLKVLKNRLLSACGEESCKIILDLVQKDIKIQN